VLLVCHQNTYSATKDQIFLEEKPVAKKNLPFTADSKLKKTMKERKIMLEEARVKRSFIGENAVDDNGGGGDNDVGKDKELFLLEGK